MTTWNHEPVTIQVPATSANLGPGFDSLGLALSLHDEVTVTALDQGVEIEISGAGAELADRGEQHLIVKVIRRTLDEIDRLAGTTSHQPGLRLSCVNRIPHSRGLGSSSAAIVAGILAARALHPQGDLLDDNEALALATKIEGHPDNVAPCLFGGLTIAWTSTTTPTTPTEPTTPTGPTGPTKVSEPTETAAGEGVEAGLTTRVVRLDLDTEVVVFVPEQRLATELARGLLPRTVSHEDAAANSARAALLIAALTQKLGSDVLLDGTEDRLHQSYRAPAMPESAALVGRLRGAGVPAVISGAGPTVLAFTTTSQVDSIGLEVGTGWHKHPLNVDPMGAHVRPSGAPAQSMIDTMTRDIDL